MKIVNWFKNRKIKKIHKKIIQLDSENPSKKRSLADIRSDIEDEYFKLSNIIFNAVKLEDYYTIQKIFNLKKISFDKLVDKKGYNIILYSLYNNQNSVFIKLYNEYLELVKYYFHSPSTLYSIILNKNNIQLIEFFLSKKELRDSLTKQVLAPTFLLLFKKDKKELLKILIEERIEELNNRDIKAYIIYFISYNNHNILKNILSYNNLIYRLNSQDIAELFTLAYTNDDIEAFKIMGYNEFFINSLEKPYSTVIKNFINNKDNKILKNFFIEKQMS